MPEVSRHLHSELSLGGGVGYGGALPKSLPVTSQPWNTTDMLHTTRCHQTHRDAKANVLTIIQKIDT